MLSFFEISFLCRCNKEVMLNILVVDDIFSNRLLLARLINSTGNEVIEANNGEEAIEVLKSRQVDLVFMDIEMPVMNGIETTNYIRQELSYPKNAVPIIALTAHNPRLFFEDYEDVGFDELMTKPYSIEKIKEKIMLLSGDT